MRSLRFFAVLSLVITIAGVLTGCDRPLHPAQNGPSSVLSTMRAPDSTPVATTPRIDNPPAPVSIPVATPETVIGKRSLTAEESSRFETLLAAGSKLEKAGKPLGAINQYQILWMEFEETDRADQLATRISSLGGKLPTSIDARGYRERRSSVESKRLEAARVKAERARLASVAPTPAPSAAPVYSGGSSSGTHVGPRGGVYHYSKSGNKVYHKR